MGRMTGVCVVDGCEKRRKTLAGHCGMHNERLRNYGDVNYVGVIRGNPHKRFWSKVEKTETCWLWTGYLDPDGYGRFHFEGSPKMAHRWAWSDQGQGEIPDGMHLDHLCKVRNCVNPDHLEVVTPTENYRRSDCPSGINYRKTCCPVCGGDFERNQRGYRYCPACREKKYQAWSELRRERKRSA